jgi:hypothetical protein
VVSDAASVAAAAEEAQGIGITIEIKCAFSGEGFIFLR